VGVAQRGVACGISLLRVNQWYSGQICLTFSNAKVSVNLTILHPLILALIIPILGNIWKRVANFRHKFVSCSRLLVCVGE